LAAAVSAVAVVAAPSAMISGCEASKSSPDGQTDGLRAIDSITISDDSGLNTETKPAPNPIRKAQNHALIVCVGLQLFDLLYTL
jgi:hypothetical protein